MECPQDRMGNPRDTAHQRPAGEATASRRLIRHRRTVATPVRDRQIAATPAAATPEAATRGCPIEATRRLRLGPLLRRIADTVEEAAAIPRVAGITPVAGDPLVGAAAKSRCIEWETPPNWAAFFFDASVGTRSRHLLPARPTASPRDIRCMQDVASYVSTAAATSALRS